ncbi:MAG: hypothetical protein AAF492_23255, partial [Verrucomicrobiota bacterium]
MMKNISIGFSFLLSIHLAMAQLPAIQLHALNPPGGRLGTELRVKVSGRDLDGANTLLFNHPGIKAEAVYQEADPFLGRKRRVAGEFNVSIARDVPPGFYEARVSGDFGISNPRSFSVESFEVVAGKPCGRVEAALELPVNRCFFGTAEQNRFQFFRFDAKQGQSVAIECHAERIDSRMDATLDLLDESGRVIAQSRDRHRRDPLILADIPHDGPYVIRLYDFTFRGGEAWSYRLMLSAGPYVESIFPPAGLAGSTGEYTLYGLNLPGRERTVHLTVPVQPDSLGLFTTPSRLAVPSFSYRFENANPIRVGFAAAPVQLERETNDKPGGASVLPIPGEIAGRFARASDRDVFRLEAAEKQSVLIEVFAERIQSPVDPVLRIYRLDVNGQGKETMTFLAESDDTASSINSSLFGDAHRDA